MCTPLYVCKSILAPLQCRLEADTHMCKHCCFQLQCYFTYTQKLTKNQTLHGKNNNKCHIKAVKASASQINNFYINIPILKTLPCRSIIKNTKICFFTCCGAEIFHEHTDYLINQASSQPDTKMCLCALRITSSYWITHQTKQLKKKKTVSSPNCKTSHTKTHLSKSEYFRISYTCSMHEVFLF